MSLSISLQELLAVLQLCLAQPAVFATVVAPPVYKVLSSPTTVPLATVELCVQVGLRPHILPIYPLQWEVGV